MTTRGHQDILIGIEVENITYSFLKPSQHNTNTELQALSVTESVLLGTQYAARFPRLVHSLESGQGIFEVRLRPSSPHVTVDIAGLYHSFNLILERVGDMATMLTNFTKGISY